jgi:hypothetical protein
MEVGCAFSRRNSSSGFARRERISDVSLSEAVRRAVRGLVDADLGGGVIKQRIARPGRGRSAGYRALIAHRSDHISVFLYGFAKSERDNLRNGELETVRDIAGGWLKADAAQLTRALADGVLKEVQYHEDEKD